MHVATLAQKTALGSLKPEALHATTLAGDAITAKMTRTGQQCAYRRPEASLMAGRLVRAARACGTEDICKLYAESLQPFRRAPQIKSSPKRSQLSLLLQKAVYF